VSALEDEDSSQDDDKTITEKSDEEKYILACLWGDPTILKSLNKDKDYNSNYEDDTFEVVAD
jgi:hypothetical protein